MLLARLVARMGAVALVLALAAPLHAETAVTPVSPAGASSVAAVAAKIPTMDAKALDGLIGQVIVAVNTDSRRLAAFQSSKACLELYRAANSFAAGYAYLIAIGDRASQLPSPNGPQLRSKSTQARVVAFAARSKAQELIAATCRNFPVPEQNAGDARFAAPAPIVSGDYTRALVDGRFAAEANLAAAVAADRTGRCADVGAAVQAMSLLIPYLSKLYKDSEPFPEALGPAASRRALNQERLQLGAAISQLDMKYATRCNATGAPAAPDATAPAPAAPTP
jgi:hypothetical protein